MKRIAAVLTLAGTSLLGFAVAPAANAADCPDGTVVQAHVHGNLNGTPVDQDVCLPPAG
jgi:hypothetical protein